MIPEAENFKNSNKNIHYMKKTDLMTMTAAIALAASSCAAPDKTADEGPVIGRQEVTVENGRMTPEALWAMGRIGSSSVSPDGKRIAYTVSYYSVKENKGHTVIYMMNADGSDNRLLTTTAASESDPTWIRKGSKLAFLTGGQIWEMNPDGSERRQLSDVDGGVDGFKFSPDESKVLFVSQVKYGKRTADIYPDLDKASGKIIDDLMYKHWDEWVETVPHPFVAPFDGNKVGEAADILKDEPYESPMKPFGGMEQLAWSPASDKIAYTCRKKTGLAYAVSTDSDIYLYDLATGKTENLCKLDGKDKNMGYDINPQFSPDGRFIAWQSMEHDGYESDLNRLYVLDLQNKEKFNAASAFKTNVDTYVWNPTSDGFYLTGTWHGTTQIYRLGLDDWKEAKAPVKMTEGLHDYGSVALNGNRLVATRHSMSQADELYSVPTDFEGQFAEASQLTTENKHIFDKLEMGRVEERWVKTTDGKKMLVWVVYPPQFDPKKKYPALLFCEGGPQSPLSQFWSFRWNFQIMAANDYIVVAPCRRGMPGFGPEWNEAISGDYGGQCMKDYLTAIDEVAKEPFVDKEHLGCVGASFGGFSVYWLAGHHDKRFKAFIAHDGIFNMEMQYLETEEKWFANWDMGGAYWDKSNATAQRTFANSPHRFVDKWDTPILCIHGEKDYRILANQAMAAFDAAKMRGIPAELLIFPDENHWVLKPQNGVLWQRTFFHWLDRWLKPEK